MKVWGILKGEEAAKTLEVVETAKRLSKGENFGIVLLGKPEDSVLEKILFTAGSEGKVICYPNKLWPPGYVIAAITRILEQTPQLIFVPHNYSFMDSIPRLAAKLNCAILTNVHNISEDNNFLLCERPVLEGKMTGLFKIDKRHRVIVSLSAGIYEPKEESSKAELKMEDISFLQNIDPLRKITSIEKAAEEQVDLSQAEIIIGVGRGIGKQENLALVEELAKILKAEIGASRPVVDNGWLPRDRQIGSSGQTVSPKLYIALGISGAIQHVVGMKGSKTIVSINKDRNAPIFNISRYGIVGNLEEILPAILNYLKETS